MWIELFLCLLLAHLIADFALQTRQSCSDKANRKWKSPYQYGHAAIVFAISWLFSFDLHFWCCALLIGLSHLLIDIWKSFRAEKVEWFVLDQMSHLLVLACISFLWCRAHNWSIPFDLDSKIIALAVAAFVCWKPANIFIKLMLRHYSVNVPEEDSQSVFNAGALIGNLERWLILVFVLLHHYEALGLLIAAKSIIRFGDSQKRESEYVLAGTLLSISIAVFSGLLVTLL
ncbi:MAG: DUF3307 domain-containing protein [Bacteroidales bacterium]|nr:DUF3307 domain-containing protein [Bacteroidales bacterium]